MLLTYANLNKKAKLAYTKVCTLANQMIKDRGFSQLQAAFRIRATARNTTLAERAAIELFIWETAKWNAHN